MTLQSSGAISLSQINSEMGYYVYEGSTSLTTRSTTNINAASQSKPDGNAPHYMSEFYGYDHQAGGGNQF